MILSIYSFIDGKMLSRIDYDTLSKEEEASFDILDFENIYNEDLEMRLDLAFLIEDCYPKDLGYTGFFILKNETEILGIWRPCIGYSFFDVAEHDERVRIKRFMPHLTCNIIGE